MILDERFITINDKKVKIPSGSNSTRFVQLLFLAGHVSNSIEFCKKTREHKLNATEEDHKIIIECMESTEEDLFSYLEGLGGLISAVELDSFEVHYLKNTGDLISIISKLVQTIQYCRYQVLSSVEQFNKAEKSPNN